MGYPTRGVTIARVINHLLYKGDGKYLCVVLFRLFFSEFMFDCLVVFAFSLFSFASFPTCLLLHFPVLFFSLPYF